MPEPVITFDGVTQQMARVLDAVLLQRAAEVGCVVPTKCQRCGENSYGLSCPGCSDPSRLN